MINKFDLPDFLKNLNGGQKRYQKWLNRKSVSQYKRDKRFYKKHNKDFEWEQKDYKEKIHEAVIKSKGKDFYTGEYLDWDLISTYNNEDSKNILNYKRKFHKLPTLEHIDRDNLSEKLEFVICSWAVNDAKNDLSKESFISLCKKVIKHQQILGYLNE